MTRPVWTDEQLSQFLDGEMSQAESDRLAQDLAEDGAMFARFERMRLANAAYVSAVSKIDERPLPDAVRATLARSNAASAAGQGAETVVAFRPRRLGEILMRHRAIAAAFLVAFVGYGVMSSVAGARTDYPGAGDMVAANSAFEKALNETASAQTVRVSAHMQMTPRLSFARSDGALCRQYDVASGDATVSSVACRGAAGWRVELAAATAPADDPSDYQSASANKSPAIEAYLDAAMKGAPLDAAGEAAAIRSGWRR